MICFCCYQGDSGRPGIPGTDGASGVHVRCLMLCVCTYLHMF